MQATGRGMVGLLVALCGVALLLGQQVLALNAKVSMQQTTLIAMQAELRELKEQNDTVPQYTAARAIANRGKWTIVRIDPTSAYNDRSPLQDKAIVPWMLLKNGRDTMYVPISDELMWDARSGKLNSPLQPGNKLLFRAIWPVNSKRTLAREPDTYDFMRLNGWSRG